jgi:hypothetical protein
MHKRLALLGRTGKVFERVSVRPLPGAGRCCVAERIPSKSPIVRARAALANGQSADRPRIKSATFTLAEHDTSDGARTDRMHGRVQIKQWRGGGGGGGDGGRVRVWPRVGYGARLIAARFLHVACAARAATPTAMGVSSNTMWRAARAPTTHAGPAQPPPRCVPGACD